jgi:protein-tyrosine phosphatase
MLLAKRRKKRVIVFVCTGNTCRSPMAQGLLQDYVEKNNWRHIEVKTAGVMTISGLLPTPEAVQVMDSVEIDIRKHRSAPLTPEMLRKADLVLGMTPFHVQFALRMSPDARGKTFLLKEYTKSDLKNYQITDPMGATLEVYKRVFREIKLAIDRLIEMDVVHAPLDQDLRHEKWGATASATDSADARKSSRATKAESAKEDDAPVAKAEKATEAKPAKPKASAKDAKPKAAKPEQPKSPAKKKDTEAPPAKAKEKPAAAKKPEAPQKPPQAPKKAPAAPKKPAKK